MALLEYPILKYAFPGVHSPEQRAPAQRAGQARSRGQEATEGGQPFPVTEFTVPGFGEVRRRKFRQHAVLCSRRRNPADTHQERAQHESIQRGRVQHQHIHGGQRKRARDVRQRLPNS